MDVYGSHLVELGRRAGKIKSIVLIQIRREVACLVRITDVWCLIQMLMAWPFAR